MTAPRGRTIRLDRPLDLRLTLGPARTGRGDPSTKLRSDHAIRATRTPSGPATLLLEVSDHELRARVWGEGSEWALEQLPRLIGEHDVDDFVTDHPLVADLHARMPGLRIGATQRVLEALVAAVCGQQVSAYEAKRAHRQLMEAWGEPAPGPPQFDLVVPPHPQVLASTSHQEFHTIGLERGRADVIRRAAARAATVEALVEESPEEAEHRLRALAGVTLWTTALVRTVAMGDRDAVPVGDHDLKHLVAWVFTGERRGSDAQMLDLLEPFRGHRGRVLRLLKASGLGPPRQ